MLLRRAASLKDGPYTGFCSLPTSFVPSPHYSTQWGFYETSCLPLCPCMSSCMELSTCPETQPPSGSHEGEDHTLRAQDQGKEPAVLDVAF